MPVRTGAIVGHGPAGAAAARALTRAGVTVTIFDKSRGVGGRMATRRHAHADGTLAFDHGAPFMAATDPAFQRRLAAAEGAGAVLPWRGDRERMVGVPRMNAFVAQLKDGVCATQFSFEVDALEKDADGWTVRAGERAAGPFDAIVLAIPAPQAEPLLVPHNAGFAAAARAARYEPRWTLMLGWDGPVPAALEGIAPSALEPIGIEAAYHDADKPGRSEAATLVAHVDPAWSAANLELERATVIDRFAPAIADALELQPPAVALAHRWRYATVARPASVDEPFDRERALGLAGDWLLGPTVEAAVLSGEAVAAAILAT